MSRPPAESGPAVGVDDLNLYASVLDDALADVRPVKDLLAYAVKGEGPLSALDCLRLAYHAFGLEDDGVFPGAKLQSAFENGARLCPAELAKERARFNILAAAQAATLQKESLGKGGKADKGLTVLIVRVNESLTDKNLSMANADALRGLPKEFYQAARQSSEHFKSSVYPKMIDGSYFKPAICHADRGGRG